MNSIDWRALYAANQAAIQRAGVAPGARQAASLPTLPSLLRDAPAGGTPPLAALPEVLPGALPGAIIGPPPALPATLPGVSLPAPMPPRPRVGPARGDGALVHLPAGVDRATTVPLVCMLHGCTQDPHAFAAATRMNEAADRHGFAVVYPRQEPGGNPQRCWNWFLPEHQERGGGEAGTIARVVERLAAGGGGQAIDGRRVFVAGLSSGGAMAAILAFTHPDLFAAVAVHSGLAYGAALSMPAAFAAMARGGEDATLLGPAAHAAMGERARAV